MLDDGVIGELAALLGICQGVKPFPAWVADEEGPLLHDAVHMFDLFRWFGGGPVTVAGTAVRRRQPFRVEDDSHAIFTFASGVSGVAMSNELTRYARFELQIQGTDGVIVLGSEGNRWLRSVDVTGQSNEPDPRIEWFQLEEAPFPVATGEGGVLAAIRELVECIETGAAPSSTGEDGVASLEMVMGVYASQRAGNAPVALPLIERASQLYQLREDGHF
jgi:predicted dehydrogenase